jgi:hypothetical protein
MILFLDREELSGNSRMKYRQVAFPVALNCYFAAKVPILFDNALELYLDLIIDRIGKT